MRRGDEAEREGWGRCSSVTLTVVVEVDAEKGEQSQWWVKEEEFSGGTRWGIE